MLLQLDRQQNYWNILKQGKSLTFIFENFYFSNVDFPWCVTINLLCLELISMKCLKKICDMEIPMILCFPNILIIKYLNVVV